MKVGFACGVFDLFHAGHALMLKECKANCDFLLVALNRAEEINPIINPNKKKPVFSIEERVLIMEACKYVDEVLIYKSEEELLKILTTRRIDVRFLGEDYIGRDITGAHLPITIHYTSRSHGFSTSDVRHRVLNSQENG